MLNPIKNRKIQFCSGNNIVTADSVNVGVDLNLVGGGGVQ